MSTTPPPGPWRDAHLHLAEHGLELACINLADCATLDEALQRIAQRADETPSETGWLKATGARAEAWPQRRLPNAEELHHAGGGRKVLVVSFDHHMMSVSRRVLEMGGVTRSTPSEYRSSSAFGGSVGAIEKDPETGEPTGVLIEAACDIVRALRPEVTPDERTEAIRAAQDDLIRLKIVEVHDMFATADLVSALHRLDTSGALALNVVLYAPPAHLEGVIDAIAACAPSPRVRLGGLKLFTDGTLNSRTASMLAPYADPNPAHPAGTPFYTDDELRGFMRDMRQRDLDIAAHAIGDAAVRRLLDLWESFDDASQSTLRAPSTRGFIDEGDIDRLCRLSAAGCGVDAAVPPADGYGGDRALAGRGARIGRSRCATCSMRASGAVDPAQHRAGFGYAGGAPPIRWTTCKPRRSSSRAEGWGRSAIALRAGDLGGGMRCADAPVGLKESPRAPHWRHAGGTEPRQGGPSGSGSESEQEAHAHDEHPFVFEPVIDILKNRQLHADLRGPAPVLIEQTRREHDLGVAVGLVRAVEFGDGVPRGVGVALVLLRRVR
ncbi:MAG: amidohydrolase family protein [Phycisphaerales bacterium]